MNAQLQEFARNSLKSMLSEMGEEERRVFKLMYALQGRSYSAAEREAISIDAVVDAMEPSCLDWAMQQCSNTLKKRAALGAKDTDGAKERENG